MPGGRGRALRLDFEAREELLATLGGASVTLCYQCGACVGDCPAARFDQAFNPRRIMLAALLGDLASLTAEGSPIWKCSTCYTCYERCPQEVKPVEVITALKNISTRRGTAPREAAEIARMILTTGRGAPVLASTNRRREQLGLPPLPEAPVDELRRIVEG